VLLKGARMQSKIRVGILAYDLMSMAGGTNLALTLGNELQKEGHEVAYACVYEDLKMRPKINFIKRTVTKEKIKTKFDVMILSDIIEHIENDEDFLKDCAEITDYVLIKLPLERNLHTKFLRRIEKLSDLGMGNPSGHLHEYYIKKGINLIKKHFDILDFFIDDVPCALWSYDNLTILGKVDNKIMRRLYYTFLPKHIYSKLYVASLFCLGTSKRMKNV